MFLIVLLLSLVTLSVQFCCAADPWLGPCCENFRGTCNIFCCNCHPECSQRCLRHHSKRQIAGLSSETDDDSAIAQRRFISIDSNGDGVISEEEGRDHLMNATVSTTTKRDIASGEWFVKMDVNADGFIQSEEFDNSLA
ncbi:hypothetical protein PENTCL1PPCAC_12607 [Pristionchus entomophagus]|uniref:EF-hand domain-containing protein n=1 Tax=Pristionchus entomophagus TaxID=358040 RepID=A0AAV5T4C5_9BILA|nr:hypothetical protein PENTCL1PPCAC_12607 [Pristionchus entomophagus]